MTFRRFISGLLKAATISALTILPACKGKSSSGFEPPPLLQILHPQTQRLSSGLESLILDQFGGTIEPHRRDQVSLAVNNLNQPLVLYKANTQPYAGGFGGALLTDNVWRRREIADTNSGRYSSAVFDSQNVMRICFDLWNWGSGGERMYYIELPGRWLRRGVFPHFVIDNDPSVGLENEIRLDRAEKTHVSYYSWLTGQLRYATNTGGPWQWRVENLAESAWNQTSVTTDDANQAHIAHTTQDQTVQYLTNTSGSWQRATIRRGSNPVIRMDNRGLPHVVFQDGGLYHAVNFNDVWNTEQLPASRTLDGGNRLSFEIDRNDRLNVLYLSDTRDSIFLMTDYSGQWREHLLDNSGSWGNPRIAIDNADRIHIAGSRGGFIYYLNFHPSQLPP